ncbi:hypothetical protein LTR10_011757 [Elasticomyces elasticus]|uniref:FAD-binding domain-containing protein n=1 Tax=Exophiala sideris TaxID=1016849 RepID=A0ABR0JDF5_9EURO|nr:hypothetical protein LTR10_011757 [Elasticomyces elasticus]KAK5031786.1 hypothetical protein LTS07_004406 [Exophiala sideris]KAK5040715.1 hypothetical protein LTR13_003015 [Exophiala sideris]KAK5061951.1 hypothetical protein LTR69_005135 [Exophiala sideris]KAK5184651.1 hypothetical protein LTR44_003326 [Eurotiomycetes sp. CCFEE 6388]
MHNPQYLSHDLPESTFALIVGGGPVGIATALSLARYGYECVVVERHAERLGQPKAHVLNPRTLEIFHQYGIDLDPLRKLGVPPNEADVVRFVASMTGIEFGKIGRQTDEDTASVSPEPTFNVAQPHLEDHLLATALATGKITYLRMHEWMGCSEEPDRAITSQIQCRKTNVIKTIQSKYLVGCDGAKARSRDGLQINFQPLNGPGTEQVLHYASVHFQADLSHMKTGLLWFILKPEGMRVFIAYNRKNSWVYFTRYDPTKTPKTTFTSKYFEALVFEAIGKPLPDYQELGITLWTTSPKLADTYRSSKIRNAFLAGDAAHSFPPTGGLGVNTGIEDVQNLTWKIHAVQQGWATESFLETVTTERLPIAKDNCQQSKLNEDKIFRLITAILVPGKTAEEVIADPASRKAIQDEIDKNRDHFHSLNLQVGYVYGRPHIRGPADYQRELVSGARLPHVWLERNGQKISSLDLVSGFDFVLITPSQFTQRKQLDCDGVPVSVQQLNQHFLDIDGEWQEFIGQDHAAVLVRPDQHIVGTISSMEDVGKMLANYLRAR